jgi:predicted lipoprotein with Yx(FWY)xxD motif
MYANRSALGTAAVLGAAIVASSTVPSMAATRPAPARAAKARPARVQLRKTFFGEILVDGRGYTLYAFSRDGRRKDRCATINGCPLVWPALQTHGKPRAGKGVRSSKLGTIKLSGGAVQVTYAGRPLYIYSIDTPGSTLYVGTPAFGGVWRAVKASGSVTG